MRKIIRYLLLSATMAFMMLGTIVLTGCISQPQSTHTCSYEEFSPGVLAHINSDEEHDFLKMCKPAVPEITDENGYVTQAGVEGGPWVQNYTAEQPFIKAYCMTYKLALDRTVTLGENVYIAICTHSADLTFEGGEVIVPENSGFFVYDCAEHACYAGMEATKGISNAYLDFAYRFNGNSTWELPAGNYGLTESVFLSDYILSGKIAFENPSHTTICLNNFAQGVEGEQEASRLYDCGIQRVYLNCDEFKATQQKHICTYMQDEMCSIPVNQAKFDEVLPTIGTLTASTENLLHNYIFLHLTENVSCSGQVTIPQGIKIGVCRNGFTFDVPDAEGLYVFDCKEHVCVGNTINVMTPIWKDGLEIMSAYLADIHTLNPSWPAEIVLGDGKYALMDDFAENELPASIVFGENVQLCRNGHTVAGNENAYADGYTWDCKAVVEETTHVCDKLPVSDEIIIINYQTVEEVVMSGALAAQGDVVVVLEEDMLIPSTLIVPQGTSLYLCLNGHSLLASQELHDSESPYLFFVEFGASLTIVNCKDAQNCGLFTLTEDMLLAEEKTYNEQVAPIYNMGVCTVNNISLLGAYGVENTGHFIADNCTITGLFVGVSSDNANYDDYPLYSKKPTVKLNNTKVVGLLCGTLILGGDSALNDCTINSMLVGIVQTDTNILEGEAPQKGTLTINNVDISMSMDMLEGYATPEVADNFKELLEGGVVGVMATGDICVEGDLNIEVDPELLEPFVNDSGELIIPQSIDFVMLDGKFNIADNAELTQQYTVYCPMENGGASVLANKDLKSNLLLMGGMASVINKEGEMVVVAGDEALFMNNAVVYDASISLEGYLRLEIYFVFDTVAQYLFIPNEESRVIVTIGSETKELVPAALKKDGQYVYTIDLYAMDYAKTVNVQFTNGQYTWTGIANISIERILTNIMAEINLQVNNVKEVLSNSEATEEDIAKAKATLDECYALKNAIISMLNYCGLAAVQFGTQDSYEAPLEELTFIVEDTITDETTGEETVVTEELSFTMTQAMEYVTADMLEDYQLNIAYGARLPEGVTFLGASLILNSGLDIRFYFRLAEGRTLESLVFTVDGKDVAPVAYKNTVDTYYLAIDGISAFAITHMFTVVIKDADMEAENSSAYTFEYCTLSYMYTALLNENSSESLKNLAKATYVYAEMMLFAAETLTGTSEINAVNNTEEGENNSLNADVINDGVTEKEI